LIEAMTPPFHREAFYRFGPYEVYPRSGELRKHGVTVRLQEQPLQILMLLLTRPGDIVLREEIQSKLWPDNTSVEFDLSINAAIRRLRSALGDSAEEPRYVETVARRGYRFIAAVEASQRALPVEDSKPVDKPKRGQPDPSIAQIEERELSGERSGAVRHGWKKAAVMFAAACVIATVTALVMRSYPRHRIETAIALPDRYSLVGKPALSPDGAELVAAVMDAARRSQLWVRQLESGKDQFLPQTAGASSPFLSPDGESIGYFAGNEIKRISSSGGSVTRIYAAVGPAAGAWSPTGTVLYSRGHGMPLFSVEVYGGRTGPATRLAEGETLGHKSPHFLSDGRHFVFLAPNPDERKSAVFLGSLDSLDRKLLLLGASEIEYAAPDYLLFLRNGAVLAQRFDFDRAQSVGPEMSIYGGVRRIASFSTSANGALSLEFGKPTLQSSLTWHARDGRAMGVEGEPGPLWQVSLSPDESAAAINMPWGFGGGRLNLLRFGKPGLTPVTANESGHVLDAVWSPDSRSLVYQIYGRDKTRLMMRHLDQPDSKLLLDDGYSNYPDDWSPDGKLLLCRRTGNIVFALRSDGTGKPHILFESSGELDQFRFSPDGKWVAYNSDESGREEVYAARFPEMDHTRQLSLEGGCQPMWRKDSKELFYLGPDGKVFSVNLQTGSDVSAGPPRPLFQSSVVVNCLIAQYAVTGNGQKFLMIEPVANGVTESAWLQLLRNWNAAAKAN
jgi:eukaryotic-like serine/threonine-protein kinase